MSSHSLLRKLGIYSHHVFAASQPSLRGLAVKLDTLGQGETLEADGVKAYPLSSLDEPSIVAIYVFFGYPIPDH
jgi:hypothetical protein